MSWHDNGLRRRFGRPKGEGEASIEHSDDMTERRTSATTAPSNFADYGDWVEVMAAPRPKQGLPVALSVGPPEFFMAASKSNRRSLRRCFAAASIAVALCSCGLFCGISAADSVGGF